MYFDLQKSRIYKAVRFSKFPNPIFLKTVRILSLIAGLVLLSVSSAGRVLDPGFNSALYLGLAYILIPVGLMSWMLEAYFRSYLKHPALGQSENSADLLDYNAGRILDAAQRISSKLREPSLTATAILLALLEDKNEFESFLRIGVDPQSLSRAIYAVLPALPIPPSDQFDAFIVAADAIRQARNGTWITGSDLIAALFDFNELFQKTVIDRGLDKNDLATLGSWHEATADYFERKRRFWSKENLTHGTPIGADWAYGHSWLLRNFTRDLTRYPMQSLGEEHLESRTKTIDQVENILIKSGENNVLLVGEPGIGKKTIINTFALMISEGHALPELNYKRVLDLDMSAVLSYSRDPGQILSLLGRLLGEAMSAGNVILVLMDVHQYIGGSDALGSADISQALLPYLESSRIQLIATTDVGSYHKYIESRAELNKVFQKVTISEPSKQETVVILQHVVPAVEYRSGCFFTYGAIKSIVEGADRYIQTSPFPEKAIELLNEVVGHARVKGGKGGALITPDVVNETVTLKTNIPVGAISGDERQKLLDLETEMKKEVVGQEEAIQAVSRTMQRLRADVVKREKPAGVFLFIGPTGVGKTQTAKTLAKIYFGSPDRMIRFDMSEYQDPQSIDRLIGSARLNEPGQLPSRVRDNPFSLILLDEIEKADKGILNIFLRVFDEGVMTDVFGKTVNFKQSIIIATSNAAAELVRDMVNQGLDPAQQKENLMNALVSGGHFSPEFLNRFDEIVIYHPLDQNELSKVAEILLSALKARLQQQGYLFTPTTEIIEYISQVGFDPQFGARPMQRAIQDKIENVIARKIIEGTVVKGTEFGLALAEIK